MEQGLEGGAGRGSNVLLSGGTAISCNGGALRDSRNADRLCVGGYPMLCGNVCVHRGCDRVCSVACMAPSSASIKRFLLLIMPKRRDCAKSVSASIIDLNMG